jgi:hypothetical protein
VRYQLALLCVASVIAAGCNLNVCNYKGTEYHQGDTWTDGCQVCYCPAKGAKTLWCTLPCNDGGTDGAVDGSRER